MRDHSEIWNHGVKGSVLILRSICGNPANVMPRDVISAFAIAVHDKEIWDALATGGFFPLRMDLFPLSCLLLELDAIQEWGRQKVVSGETRLVGISIDEESVTCDVAFESLKTIKDKDAECNKARQCVISRALTISLNMNIRKRLNR